MHGKPIVGALAAIILAGAAHAALDPEMDRHFTQTSPWLQWQPQGWSLPCAPRWEQDPTLPPCALPPTAADEQRERIGALQQICRSVVTQRGAETLCQGFSAGR